MTFRRYAVVLWLLLSLFCLRVAAQLVQWRGDISFLPPFQAWHSAVVPYWVLLSVQVLIIAGLGKVAFAFTTGRVTASRRAARIWLTAGMLYMSVMITRLTLGLTLLANHDWFSNRLPTVFHIVLASFIILVGMYHRSNRSIT